jgi:hypothetical protein
LRKGRADRLEIDDLLDDIQLPNVPIIRVVDPDMTMRMTEYDVLHVLTLPRFGKRESPDRVLTPEEHHRRLLGLPLDRRLFGAEINAAFKHAAKTVHPDAGGSERDFLALSQARDALMKRA